MAIECPRFGLEEIDRRGEEWWQKIRPQVETAENIGKRIAIDIESGDYEIDDNALVAADRLRARHPNAVLYTPRIGYDAAFAIGGTLRRSRPR